MWLIALKAIAGNVLVAVSAFGFGTWLSRFLPDSFSRFTRLVCTTIGGFGLLGLLLFIVGQVSFHRTTIGIVLATGVTSAVASKPWLWEFTMPIHKIPAAIVAAVLLLTAFGGLAEPVGDWGIDGVAYHYVGPKVWLREGIIRPIPDNAPTSYPSLVEVVFGALRAFGGERAPVFSAVWTLAFFLAVAVVLGLRCGLSTRGAWWAAALTATMGALYQGSHSGFVDAVYAAFILAGIRIGFDASEKKHFLAFGFFLRSRHGYKISGTRLAASARFVRCVARQRLERVSDDFKRMHCNCSGLCRCCAYVSPELDSSWQSNLSSTSGSGEFSSREILFRSRTEGILRIFRLARKRPGPRTSFVFTPAIQPDLPHFEFSGRRRNRPGTARVWLAGDSRFVARAFRTAFGADRFFAAASVVYHHAGIAILDSLLRNQRGFRGSWLGIRGTSHGETRKDALRHCDCHFRRLRVYPDGQIAHRGSSFGIFSGVCAATPHERDTVRGEL